MSAAKPTPGPWKAGLEFKPGKWGLQDVIAIAVAGEVVAHVNCGFGRGEANAELIVKAVNSHETLLAALREVRKWLKARSTVEADSAYTPEHALLDLLDVALNHTRGPHHE